MAEFYFFKTVVEKGRNRLRPLSGQKLDGVDVDTTLSVQSDKVIRATYPIGTVFGSSSLELRSGFYAAGNIYPLGLKEYKDDTHRPPESLQRAYEVFIGASTMEGVFKESGEDFDERPDSLLAKMRKNKRFRIPSVDEDGFYVDLNCWYLLLRNMLNQVNTMLIGPTGTGKTSIIRLACTKLGIPCSIYDMGSMYDPIAGMLGVHRLQEGGVSEFDYAKFTQDVARPGVVVLDELSRAPVTTANILFPCLDDRRELPVEMAGGKDMRRIKVHPECCFIATANVGAEYTGTMSMDRALVGRFFPVELDYMPKDSEVSVLVKRGGISSSEALHIVGVANTVRSLYRKGELGCSLSTRETLMAAELVADGWNAQQAMEMVFLPLFEGTYTEGERGIVRKSLMSR